MPFRTSMRLSGVCLVFSIKCKIERRHNIGGNAISTTGGFDPCRDPSVIHTSCLGTIPHTTCLCHNCIQNGKKQNNIKYTTNTKHIQKNTKLSGFITSCLYRNAGQEKKTQQPKNPQQLQNKGKTY